MIKNIRYFVLFLLLIISSSARAEGGLKRYFDYLKYDISTTWNEGRVSAYVPFWAWHNRLTYDDEHIKKYNEEPWGFGLGLSRYDNEKNWHGLYAMGFKDSNNYLETFFGYAYIKNIILDDDQDWLFGYGYTLGLTQRHEYSYIPVPLPLPLLSFAYKKLSLNAAYVPGWKNDGNVLFTWMRVDF